MAVLVANDFPPARGGIQRYVERLADALRERSEPVLVLAPATGERPTGDAERPYSVRRYPGRGKLLGFCGMLAWLAFARAGMRRSATIAAIWFPAGLAAVLLPRPLRGRLVVLAHGSEIAPSRGGLRRALMRWVFRRADVVAANSTFTASLLAAVGIARNVRVIPCGVDAFEPPPRRSDGPPTMLAVGRLVRRKGFDRLIDALPAVRAAIPTARLVIVGDGPLRDELRQAAAASSAAAAIEFRGAIDDVALRQAYAEASLFALPVRRIADDVEGFGIVYLEAAMAELPTIGGRNSGAVDAIVDGETGLLVDGDDAAAVASAAVALLSDREAAAEMGRRGRRRALERFNWAATAASIEVALGGCA